MSESMHKQAVIYCRVSSVKQTRAGDGLSSQETRCREFARMKGHTVLDVFRDDVSGGLIDRPGMKAMLAFMRKHRSGGLVVIIDDVSRLARGLNAHLELRGAIAKAGGTLESPSIEFGEDSDSILVENLLASVSQHQRQKNGEQTRNRMHSRLLNGYWPFRAPIGYKHKRVSGRGMVLTPDEPAALMVREALEGYASGRFETQADVMRFLQDSPLFPKDKTGIVRHQRVNDMLTQCVYAGYVEAKKWNLPMREGQHEGLISLETFQRVQDKLSGKTYAPRQPNVNEDFPLRGYVLCDDCETPLTACWSKGSHARYPYYLCPKRGCASYGKSIRRDKIEGEFEALLQSVRPTEKLFRVASAMFRDLWDHQLSHAKSHKKALEQQLTKIDRQVNQLLERIVNVSQPGVIAAYEEKIAGLERDKLLIRENMTNAVRPRTGFEGTLRTALAFLSNPWNLWSSGQLEDRKTVLKLTFAQRLRYARGQGFRTMDYSMPFRLLRDISGGKSGMAPPRGIEPLFPT